jgi:hypothetical protein
MSFQEIQSQAPYVMGIGDVNANIYSDKILESPQKNAGKQALTIP